MITDSLDVQTTLAQALQEFWGVYTGVRREYARIVVGDQALQCGLAGFYLRPNDKWLAPGLDEKCWKELANGFWYK